MYSEEAGKPLSVKQWCVMPYIFTREDAFASVLIGETVKFAREMKIGQIITGYDHDSVGTLWLDNGFAPSFPLKAKSGGLFLLCGIRTDK